MARTFKARRVCYDNIASGSAISSRERTISGALPPAFDATYGNIENITVGNDYGAEKVIVKGTTLMTGERLG